MRILVISNIYPPYHLGGYELSCADIVDALRRRGHQVVVMTGWRGLRRPQVQSGVARLLQVRFPFDPPYHNGASRLAWYLWNLLMLRTMVRRLKPDVVHVFNPSGLGPFTLNWLHSQPVPVVHEIGDEMLAEASATDIWAGLRLYYNPRSPVKRIIKVALLKIVAPHLMSKPVDLSKSYFRSKYLKRRLAQAGVKVGNSPIIYHGLRLADLVARDDQGCSAGIVFSGRLTPEKGGHVFLEALSQVKDSHVMKNQRITIIGPVIDQGYYQKLRELASILEPQLSVRFVGRLSRPDALQLMREHSIFVFPVIGTEGFGVVVLEALGSGLAVVATAAGGSTELLENGENCLVVPKNDPGALANALERLVRDESLRQRISRGGIESAKHFDFERAVDLIEEHLRRVGGLLT
jgi:glycogen synthase